MEFSALPVRRVDAVLPTEVPYAVGSPAPAAGPPAAPAWPATIPAVAQLLREGLELTDCTIFVGPNGSGKSTIIEAVATAYGLNPEGGSTGAQHRTQASESPLHEWLRLTRGAGSSKWGYFVRAETMHGLFTYLSATRSESRWSRDPEFHALSHGESFVALLGSSRFGKDGFFVMDEPEAGLSFEAQLHLVAELADMARRPRAQVLVATHSPQLDAGWMLTSITPGSGATRMTLRRGSCGGAYPSIWTATPMARADASAAATSSR